MAALSVGPAAPALAQDAIVDPGPDTPAGTQYQIPVDTARQDAAPNRHAPKRHNGTTLQSENGFGSSSVVPTVAAARPATTPARSTRPPRVRQRRAAKAHPRAPTRTTRTATTPVVRAPKVQQFAAPSTAAPASDSAGSSGLILLLGSVVVAGGVGSAARRRR